MLLAELFRMPLERLRDELDADEYSKWQEWYAKRPWGCDAEDKRLALLCTVVNRSLGGKGTMGDFEPGWDRGAADGPKDNRLIVSFAGGIGAMEKMFGGGKVEPVAAVEPATGPAGGAA